MVISSAQTKSVTIAATPVSYKLLVDNKILGQIVEVKDQYLDVTILSYGSTGKEISCQVTNLPEQGVRRYEQCFLKIKF